MHTTTFPAAVAILNLFLLFYRIVSTTNWGGGEEEKKKDKTRAKVDGGGRGIQTRAKN